MATYRTKWGSDTIEIEADFAHAACQVIGTNGRRVADFRHDPKAAMRYALEQQAWDEGENPDEDEEVIAQIEVAVEAMRVIED